MLTTAPFIIPIYVLLCIVMFMLRYILNKKERYIKFSLKLRIFHLNKVMECIVLYNHQCFMVDMSCRGDR